MLKIKEATQHLMCIIVTIILTLNTTSYSQTETKIAKHASRKVIQLVTKEATENRKSISHRKQALSAQVDSKMLNRIIMP